MMRARVLLVLLSLAPLTAQAQTPGEAPPTASPVDTDEQRARELFQNGTILYDEGRYEDAISAWEEAYRLTKRHVLLYNIANAQERLGRWQNALDTLNRYRAYATADEREALDRRIRNLERRIEIARTSPAPTPAAPTATPTPASPAATQTYTTTVQKPKKSRVLSVTLLSVGTAGLASGVVFGLQSRQARLDAEGVCSAGEGGYLCPIEAQDSLDRSQRTAWIADASFGVGALAITAGVLTLFWPSRESERSASVGVAVQVGSGEGSVQFSGHF